MQLSPLAWSAANLFAIETPGVGSFLATGNLDRADGWFVRLP
jgi:hypothetical protein